MDWPTYKCLFIFLFFIFTLNIKTLNISCFCFFHHRQKPYYTFPINLQFTRYLCEFSSFCNWIQLSLDLICFSSLLLYNRHRAADNGLWLRDSGETKCLATGLVTELSDGVGWKNRKHMFEESSVVLLWQVKPQPHVCQRCISKNWLGTGFSRVNQLQVINPPLISAQQVVNWLLLLIHGYFVIWRFSVALFMGLL